MIQLVLLDLDGTLIDSNEAHAHAWMDALAEERIQVEYRNVRRLIGMGGDHLIPLLTGFSHESELGRKISKRHGEIFRSQYLPSLNVFPEARELVVKMKKEGLTLVVASSASRSDLQALLQKINIADLVEAASSADETTHSKPSPDIISAALQKTPFNPQEAVLLGDTPYDIQAAAKAGVRTIAFTCGGWGVHELDEAIAIYEGPWQLLADYDTSALSGNLTKQVLVSNSLYSGSVPPY